MKLFLALALMFTALACNGQTKTAEKPVAKSQNVEVYYFHFTNRCMTCNTVEAEAKKNVASLYPELYKQGRVSFKALNLDEKSTDAVAERLKVSGQTLLIVSGSKQENITNDAFLYARSSPEKLRAEMKSNIDKMLK